jgi:hypothetical protein
MTGSTLTLPPPYSSKPATPTIAIADAAIPKRVAKLGPGG